MDGASVITAGLSTLFGGAITWLLSRAYYLRASRELTAEASQLRQLTLLMLRGMEAAKWVKYNRDDKGNPIGIVFEVSGGGTLSMSGEVTTRLIRPSNET